MKFRDICEKVKSGEISFDLCGHWNSRLLLESFLQNYDQKVANEGGANDGKWRYNDAWEVDKVDADMRGHFKRALDAEVGEGEAVLTGSEEVFCAGCGHSLRWVLNDDSLTLRHYWDGKEWRNRPLDFRCDFAEPKPTTGQIAVTGKLVFANFFRHVEDSTKEDEHTSEWSLNSQKGRANITKFKADRNVAYGQMSNMSVGIFVSPDNKSIIVGNKYVADDIMEAEYAENESDELADDESEEDFDEDAYNAKYEALSVIDGHKMVGSFHLSVWRWEATDLADLGEKHFKEAVKEFDKDGVVVVEVPAGAWQFEHYFGTGVKHDKNIYARLKLKE